MNAARPASPFRQFIVLLFLAAGVQCWIGIGGAELGDAGNYWSPPPR